MNEHLTYWGSLSEEIAAQSRDLTATLPLWELCLFVFGILVGVLSASFIAVLICRFAVRRVRLATPKVRRWICIGVGAFLVYVGLYFGTTTVRPQGHGV